MVFKILNIKGCETTKQVLVQLLRTTGGEDIVSISAWHVNADGSDIYQCEEVRFTGYAFDHAEQFIKDFSQESANKFANLVDL